MRRWPDLVRRAWLLPLVLCLALSAGCGTATGETATAPTSAPASSSSAQSPAATPTKSRRAAPDDAVPAVLDFTGETLDGKRFDGASLAGSPTVLWFWAPWCPTCRAQIEGVSSLADQYGDRVDVVGVGGLDDTGAIADFAAEVSPAVTILSDSDGEVWRHFAITAQSVYVVLDADGEMLADGYLEDEALREVVAAATA